MKAKKQRHYGLRDHGKSLVRFYRNWYRNRLLIRLFFACVTGAAAGGSVYGLLHVVSTTSYQPASLAAGPTSSSPATLQTSPVRICSWNLMHLGWKQEKDITSVANVAKSSCDVIAIEELMTPSGLASVAKELQPDFKFIVSPRKVGGSRYGEYYGFLYRHNTVMPTGRHWQYPDPGNHLIREPFAVEFRSGTFDFVLVPIHAVYKKLRDRIEQAAYLDDVIRFFQQQAAPEKDIILCGDFNLEPDHPALSPLRDIGFSPLISSRQKTTVGHTRLANSYDNCWIDRQQTIEADFSSAHPVQYFHVGKNNELVRKFISDHLPIVFTAATGGLDDD